MSQVSFVESGIDRVQEAFRSVESRVEKLQKDLGKRRRQLERDAQKRVKSWRTELRRSDLAKRVEGLQKDARKQLESGVDNVLSSLQIASQSDIKKLDRKLGQISRKLNALEKSREQKSSGSRASA